MTTLEVKKAFGSGIVSLGSQKGGLAYIGRVLRSAGSNNKRRSQQTFQRRSKERELTRNLPLLDKSSSP